MTDAISVTYDEVDLLLHRIVWRFVKSTGHDPDELMSDARLAYMKAYLTHNESKGPFVNWLGFIVERTIIDELRKKRKAKRLLELPEECEEKPKSLFQIEDFLHELSEDARTVVRLVFDQPIDIKATVLLTRKETPRTLRVAIREFLRDIGWSSRRVAETFLEIRLALRN